MVEEQIIKLFCLERFLFTKYYKYVNLSYIKINYSNIYKLFLTIEMFYDNNNSTNSISKADLDVAYNSNYLLVDSERQELSETLSRIMEDTFPNRDQIITLLEMHKVRCLSGDIAKVALDVEDGSADLQDLLDKIAELDTKEIEAHNAVHVDMDLAALHESQIATPGLRWRLKWLNKALGSLRQGDFGFIFARPETGKTTFLASEITHMISQTDKDIIWFNNEEQGKKVAIRCYQALLGLTSEKLFSDVPKYAEQYKEMTGGRLKIYDFEDSSHHKRIDEILRSSNPGLIIFDQIDKIKGFKADRNDLELKAIYQWAREIAKTYAPVIAVSQAGGVAEGQLWLTMDMVDSSKTAKQGEADWILGIGKDQDNSSRRRYLNISKNKLLGDPDTLPDLRHGQTQVIIQPEIARYEDLH